MSEATDVAMEPAASEGYDFENDGLKTQDVVLTVTNAEEEEKENGTRWKLTLDSNGAVPYALYVNEWTKHTTAKAQEIGRSNIKRFLVAATGSAKVGSVSDLIGKRVLAEIYEDPSSGFARTRKYRSAPVDTANQIS